MGQSEKSIYYFWATITQWTIKYETRVSLQFMQIALPFISGTEQCMTNLVLATILKPLVEHFCSFGALHICISTRKVVSYFCYYDPVTSGDSDCQRNNLL